VTNYSRVRNGMSELEVHNLLGNPTECGRIMGGEVLVKTWQKGKCAVDVYFSGQGAVVEKHAFGEFEETALERKLGWLGLSEVEQKTGILLEDK
jgi:hypothetical protein